MLKCGWNFKGSRLGIGNLYNYINDEDHQLNHCIKFRDTNSYDSTEKLDFQNVFSDDIIVLQNTVLIIQKVLNTKTAHGI